MSNIIIKKYDDNTQICWSIEEAQQTGLLSRSRCREQDRTVPEDARPDSVVVQEIGRVHKADCASISPVVSQDDQLLILAKSWFDVFKSSQTVLDKRGIKSESSILTLSSINSNKINTRGGRHSLLNEKNKGRSAVFKDTYDK